jgi:hypothetical protein
MTSMKLSITYILETADGEDFEPVEVTALAELIKDPKGTGDSPDSWDITDIKLDNDKEFEFISIFDQRKIIRLLEDEARGY